MLNHRLLNAPLDTSDFVKSAIDFLQKYAKNKKVFCALSGGVDSTATYLLLKKAKINAISAFIDHGLMRLIRGTEEREYIKKFFPDVYIIDIREQFLPKIFGEGDAEIKRKLFKSAYSDTINRFIDEKKCDLLADGTILPDIEESFGVTMRDLNETMSIEEELALKKKKIDGFVKSQHNVDIQYNVKATIQPVANLTKDRVRDVLKFFNMPQELIYRKAFPGPALAARIIGPVTPENLNFEKKVHDIVESEIDDYYFKKFGKQMIVNELGEQEPFQAFAAIGEDIINKKVTGIVNGKRTYDYPISIKGKWDYEPLFRMASTLEGYSRIFYEMKRNLEGKYDVVIRSINSKDARTANPTNLPLDLLKQITKKIIQFTETKDVFYDLTPKPPGTIEYV